MEFHPVANIFPMMSAEEFDALKADIATNGLVEPIWTHENKIIDGRNRYQVCEAVGIKPRFQKWSGEGSLVQFVVSLNLKRRHLTSSQKAVVAEEIEKLLAEEAKKNLSHTGGDKKSAEALKSGFQKIEKPIHAAEQAAAIVGTNRQYVSDVKKIRRTAPELIEPIRNGHINIPEAKQVAAVPAPQRSAVVDKIKTGAAKTVTEATRQVFRAEAKEAGITPQEDAANDPGVRWSKAMHKLWVFINGTRDHGGISNLTRKWSASVKRGYLVELREMRDKITEWIETIEKELAK